MHTKVDLWGNKEEALLSLKLTSSKLLRNRVGAFDNTEILAKLAAIFTCICCACIK